jgi:hypothetical protein
MPWKWWQQCWPSTAYANGSPTTHLCSNVCMSLIMPCMNHCAIDNGPAIVQSHWGSPHHPVSPLINPLPSPNHSSPINPQLPPPPELIDNKNIVNLLLLYAPHHPMQLPPHSHTPSLPKVKGHMTFEQLLFFALQWQCNCLHWVHYYVICRWSKRLELKDQTLVFWWPNLYIA